MFISEQQLELINKWVEHEFYPPTKNYTSAVIRGYIKQLASTEIKYYGLDGKEVLNEIRQKWIEYNKPSIK